MSISNKPELIGISGTLASGKDTLTHHLEKEFGYTHVTTSDLIREIAKVEYGSIERPVLYKVAQHHRGKDGAGVFVRKALESPRPLIVSGLRSLGEAKAIKAAGGVMLFIDASIELRYERMKQRHRDAEALLSLEGFAKNEQKEWHQGDDDADFNLRDIKATADVVIENDLDLVTFLETAYLALHLDAKL
ncbi:AAA family ATPase [Pedobacter sp.]|nr:AAA family ATPase [Candidatus Saccharibacteria bacterium]